MADLFVSYVLAPKAFDDAPCDAVVKTLNQRFGGAGVVTQVVSGDIKDKKGFILSVGDVPIVVVYADFPVPAATFAASIASAQDQSAQSRLIDHRAHAIVAVLGEHVGHEANLRAAMAALRVDSALSELSNATAIFWTDSDMLTAAALFRSYVKRMAEGPEHVPMEILVRPLPYQLPGEAGLPPRVGIMGVGFGPFIGRNIEFVPKPVSFQAMASRFSGIGRWLLMKGPVFADGETCGISAKDIIRVRYLDKGQDLAGPVLSLEIEQLDPAF